MDTRNSSDSARKQFTLRLTLVSAFCGLTLLGGIFLSTVTAMKVGEFIREELRLRLADTVNIMAAQLSGDQHQTVQTPEHESSAEYLQLQSSLRDMRERGTGIAYAYTMRKQEDGSVVFIVDSTEDSEDFSHVGDPYEDTTETLMAALDAPPATRTAFVEHEPATDEWGTWLSAFAPIYNSAGQQDGIVGIDVSANSVIEHEYQYKLAVWLVSGAVVFLVLPLGLLFARRIRKPLEQLTLEMERVKKFELDEECNIHSRIREIESMVQQLENMKRGLRSFRKYVPDALVRELIELGVDARLGGSRQELTLFFSDIANFTAISEKLEPEALVHFLGEYLDIVNVALLKNHATVDKFVGDGVMAFWGAPRPLVDHAMHACLAALQCQSGIAALNRKWKSEGLIMDFHTRIGIHTGDVVVGNMGSEERMSYTAIGDNVNLTSRLEGINKYYGTRILITESTRSQVKGRVLTRQIDKVVMAGKTVPINIYELLGETGDTPSDLQSLADQYEMAFLLYQQSQFEEAATAFETLLSNTPDDRPSTIMLERCQQYIKTPPIQSWQGEFVFSQK